MPRLCYIGNSLLPELPHIMSNDICENESNTDTTHSSYPTLKTIWDCPNLNKELIPGPDGGSVPGWICGWCPPGRGNFKGDNATKALARVAKIQGKNIRFCEGNIPQQKLIQCRNLWLAKPSAKSERSTRVNDMTDSICDI